MEHWQPMALMIIIQIVIGIVVAILGFLMKRSISQIDKRLSDGDQKFKDIALDVMDLKERRGFDREYFSKEYVGKSDYLLNIRALDYKIDLVATDVKKLLILSGRSQNADAEQ